MGRYSLFRLGSLRCLAAFAALAISGLVSTSALADDVAAQTRAARTACLAGDYAKGVALLAELFVDTRSATYVYNQARCFEQNGRHQEAIDRFREYLRIANNLTEEDKAAVEKHLVDCQALLAKAPPAVGANPGAPVGPAQVSPPAPTVALAGNTPAAVVTQPQPSPAPVEQPDAGSPGAGLRTAGVIVAGLGGAALITGVALNLKVNGMASDLEKPGAYSRDTESRRSDYATLTWVSYGVGGACLAGGAILYLLGHSQARTNGPAVAVLPAIASGGLAAVVKGAF